MRKSKAIPKLEGTRYDFLTVVRFLGFQQNKHGMERSWECRCDCGVVINLVTRQLGKDYKSCGCKRKEMYRSNRKATSAGSQIFTRYKWQAEQRNYIFCLSQDEVLDLFKQNCHYCGILPSNIQYQDKWNEFIYNGLDRLDNEKGYTITNVVPCCYQCNRSKQTYSVEEFKTWVQVVYKNLQIKGFIK